jgi:hypothetical protein
MKKMNENFGLHEQNNRNQPEDGRLSSNQKMSTPTKISQIPEPHVNIQW